MAAAQVVLAQGNMIERREAAPASHSTSAAAEQGSLLRLIPLKSGNQMLGILCLRIEQGAPWFVSDQGSPEAQERPSDQTIFFWTFLAQAVLVIERAHLRARAISNNE